MKVLVAGDYCPQNRVSELIGKGSYKLFSEPLDASFDYAIVNLECPVLSNNAKKILKSGPHLFCSHEAVEVLKQSGFSCVTLANNHTLDYGESSLLETIDVCNKAGLDTVGAGKGIKEAERILYKKINDEVIAIINCCEHEFSVTDGKSVGTNPLNPVQQYKDIQTARASADYVLIIIHGGHEHYQLPTPKMTETYRFFIDAGADAVVNHHQHCYSGYEFYKGKPVFYGLGNFCFDWKGREEDPKWTTGYMVNLSFKKESTTFEILPYYQCTKQNSSVQMVAPSSFIQQIGKLNEIIANPTLFEQATKFFYESKYKEIAAMLSPLEGRIFFSLILRGWFPSLLSKKKKALLRLYFDCDVHRDKVLQYLRNS